ncbi:hypothetical protein [Archangium lipolyticum]|uniref:hypothetical protein n=1 Tax=Archangium lipolyticum TaxID=2970465 RepID=UPI002149FABE|nr:hypothetical protein [Archangium lipolyticum]
MRYALGRTLSVEMAVDLVGLSGPVVVDPGWSSLPSGKVLVAGGSGTSTYSTALCRGRRRTSSMRPPRDT